MGIDPADPRCDPFYAAMKELGLVLLSHAGDEKASDKIAERLYLRELALELARIRARIFSEMLDGVERVGDDEADAEEQICGRKKRNDEERQRQQHTIHTRPPYTWKH